MGHAVGVPEKAGSGTWQLQVTFCDYDFTALYEEQTALFDAQRDETFANYIAPEDIGDSGAKYFLTGYNTGRGPTLLPGDSQAYHLWAEYTSPYVEKSAGKWTGSISVSLGMTGGAAFCCWTETISCWAIP